MTLNQITLPADILHLVCQELSERTDFSSLYNCLVSSKQLATSGAINALYRISHECFGRANTDEGTIEDAPPAEARQVTQKNSILWRTIILSALGHTSHQYCRHLRVLDLRDLTGLLQDNAFRTADIFNYFFSGPLAQFMVTSKATRSKRRMDQLNLSDTVAAIGHVVINQAPLLEALAEHATETVFSKGLEAWLPKLQHLRRLDMGDGRVLASESIRSLIRTHCPNLSELRIFNFNDDNADEHLANVIEALPANSMTLFENLSDCRIDHRTCAALEKHAGSLKTLSLALMDNSLLSLSKLSGCTKLTTLAVYWLRPSPDLHTTKKNECEEIAEWLKSCYSLQDITLHSIPFAPSVMGPLLRDGQVQLRSLTVLATPSNLYDFKYDLREHTEFHTLLGQQKQLQDLTIAGNADDASPTERAIMLAGLCELRSLRKLRISYLADDFVDADLQELSGHLLDLEDLSIGGFGYTDASLRGLSKLRNMKNLVISGLSRFSRDGLLDFVHDLREGNQGLQLQVDIADFDYALQPEDETLIASTLSSSVGGTFRYALSRDPNMPEYDSSDSD